MYSWNVDHDTVPISIYAFAPQISRKMIFRRPAMQHVLQMQFPHSHNLTAELLIMQQQPPWTKWYKFSLKKSSVTKCCNALWNGKLFKHFCNIFRGEKGRFSNSFLCWLTATNTRRHLFDITAEFYAHGMKKTRVTVARMKWTEKSIRFHFCIPFSSLSVFALTATAFRWTDRWIRWGKNCGKKNKSHIALCSVCTRRRNTNCTNRAFNWNTTSPTWGSFCRCPHASCPRRLQCGTLSRSQKNSLSREDL